MSRFLPIPREALAELLQALGSPLTPEQYLATLPSPASEGPELPAVDLAPFKRYPGRAWAAAMSKYCLLIVAIFGVVLYPFLGSYIENGIIVIGLITVTYFEYRVHTYFLENNPKAPELGFRNQTIFALAIIVYCLYHAFTPIALSPDAMQMLEQSNVDMTMIHTFVRGFYLFVAALAGGSQFGLACYYRRAQIAPMGDAAPPPPPFAGNS
jgi:hypothetical protein